MPKPSRMKAELKADWDDYTDRTGFHGFAEYDGFGRSLGVPGKVVWLILMALVAAFCVWQLDGLLSAFISRDCISVVTTMGKFRYPFMSIRLDSVSGPLPTDDLVAGYHNMIIQPSEYHNSPSGCPVVNETLAKASGDFRRMVEKEGGFSAYYAKRMPTTEGDLCPVAIYLSLNRTFTGKNRTMVKLLAHIQGPQYVFTLPQDHLKVTARKMEIAILKKNAWEVGGREVTYDGRYFINFGRAAIKRDTLDLGRVLHSYHDYEISVITTQYTRSAAYCDPELAEWGLTCESVCRIREAKRTGGCVPGLIGLPHGVRECLPTKDDHENCEQSFKHCTEYCDKCIDCQPCEEVSAQATVDQKLPPRDATGEKAFVNITFPQDIVQTIAMREQYTLVNFFSQLGGTLGLCFGASIVALVHAIIASLATIRIPCNAMIAKNA